MKFESLTLIRIAHRNGITLTRIGNDICVRGHSKIWVAVLKKHKRALLKHLPDDEIKSVQTDLFNDL